MPPIRAKDPNCAAFNQQLIEDLARKGFYHSIPLKDGRVLEGIISLDQLNDRLQEFPIPGKLDGLRVLDIGTWDGFFAYEMERRGATVMAIDNSEQEHFHVAHQLLESQVEYRVQDVYDLSIANNGSFDIVLFMGVLYHLKHPLLALERVCEVTRDLAIVESFVTNEAPSGEMPTLQFYETTELLGQLDNWCGPNAECLLAMCRTAGFARVQLLRIQHQRALVACYRHWLPVVNPSAPAPHLLDTTHAIHYGRNVSSRTDDYLSAFFKSPEQELHLDNVYPEVAGFGVRPVAVLPTGGDGWQANFRLPPGLSPGRHPVRIRTANSDFSNATEIIVDVPATATALRLSGACDARSFRPGEVLQTGDGILSLWVEGLPDNADRGNTKVTLGGRRLQVLDVTPAPDYPGAHQVNAQLPKDFRTGRYDLAVQLGDTRSQPLSIRVEPPTA